jgi:hypothetical protein
MFSMSRLMLIAATIPVISGFLALNQPTLKGFKGSLCMQNKDDITPQTSRDQFAEGAMKNLDIFTKIAGASVLSQTISNRAFADGEFADFKTTESGLKYLDTKVPHV